MSASEAHKKRILVIKLGALGDVIQALGPMAAIRNHHASDHVTVMTSQAFKDLIEAAKVANEVIVDTRPTTLDVFGWLSLRRKLRQGGYARVYDLQTSSRSNRYARLFWPGRKPEWSGIACGCSHPHANPGRNNMHTIERQAEQLKMAGIDNTPAPDLSPIVSDISHLKLPKDYCLIVPGGAEHRPEKRWPQAHFQKLVHQLDTQLITPVVCGSEDERALCASIVEGSAKAKNIAGETSLIDLVTVTKRARFAVGNDSGPMHIAAAANTPSVVLYSHASDPALCAQRGEDVKILREPSLDQLSVDDVLASLPL